MPARGTGRTTNGPGTPRPVCVSSDLVVRGANFVVAGTAVDRPVVPRNKRHPRRLAALGAHRVMIFADRSVRGQSSLALVLGATGRAATGLVQETLGLEELLLTEGEQELLAAVPTRKGLVRQT